MLIQFENNVADALKDCAPGTVCLASVSGGADSTAMLVALAEVKENGAAFDLRCIHVEHGIRPAEESRGDADFVRALCEKLGVPCRIVSVPPGEIAAVAKERGIGIEAAARMYRRRAWSQEAESCGALPAMVLTAHTADDMLETALMRILRGAGPSGLAAMGVRRGNVLRPLLALSRADVHAYLAEKNIPWREDSTNADTKFLRNRIRHRLVPLLNEHFPDWRTGLSSLTATQSLAADFIQAEAAARICWRPLFENASHGGTKAQGTQSLGRDSQVPSLPPCLCASVRDEGKESLCTEADNFFEQAAIVREEALFQGIDLLLKGSVLPPAVKRANVRRFSEGNITAVDLGPLEVRKTAQWVILSGGVAGGRPRRGGSGEAISKP